MDLGELKRILVVTKFRYMGDTIVATPFLRQLHGAAPEAQIALLGGPQTPALMAGCPWLAETLTLGAGLGDRVLRSSGLIRRLRAGQFDAVFLLNRSLHSAMLAAAARIPVRIGFDTEHRGRLLTAPVPYDWGKPDRECALDLLRALGMPTRVGLPELWVSPEEQAAAWRLLSGRGIAPGSLLVGMQPGANDPREREWGAERFAMVADRLASETGARIVLLGTGKERPTSERTAHAMRVPPTILTGETRLREALAVLSVCRLWISNDGGLLHAAVALGPATVGIFGPTKAARWGYDTPRHRTMVVEPAVPVRRASVIRRCLDAIEPDVVAATALSLLRAPAPDLMEA